MAWPPTPTASPSAKQTPLASLLPLHQFFPSSPGCSPTSRHFDVSPQALGFGISESTSPTTGTNALRAALAGMPATSSQAARGMSLPTSSGGGVFGLSAGHALSSTPDSPRFSPVRRTASPSAALLSKVLVGGAGSPSGHVTPSSSLQLTTSPTGDPFPLFATTSTSSDSDTAPFGGAGHGAEGSAAGSETPTLLLPLTRRRSDREPALLFSTSVSASSTSDAATMSPTGERPSGVERGDAGADATPMGAAAAALNQCGLDFSPRLLNTPRSGHLFSRVFSPTGRAGSTALLTDGGSHPALLVQQNPLQPLSKGDEAATLLTGALSSGAKDSRQRGGASPPEDSLPEPFASENDNCLQKAASGPPGASITRTMSGARSVSSPASRQGSASRPRGPSSGSSVRRTPPPSLLDPSFLFHPAQGMDSSSCSRSPALFLFDDAAFGMGGNGLGPGCGSLESVGPSGAVLGAGTRGSSGGGGGGSFDAFGGTPFSPSCFSLPSLFGVGTANAPFFSPSNAAASPAGASALAAATQRLLCHTGGGASPGSPLHLPLLSQRQQLLLHQSSHPRRNSFPSPTSGGGRGPSTPTGADPLFGVFSVSTASQHDSGDTPRARRSGDCGGSDPREARADRALPAVQTPQGSLPFPSLLELDAGKDRGSGMSGADPSLFYSSHLFLQNGGTRTLSSPRQGSAVLRSAACGGAQTATDRAAAGGDTAGLPFSGSVASQEGEDQEREAATLLEGSQGTREGLAKEERPHLGPGHSTVSHRASFLPSVLHTPSFLPFPEWQDRSNFAALMQPGQRPETLPGASEPDWSKPTVSTVASTAEERTEGDSAVQGGDGGLVGSQDKPHVAQGELTTRAGALETQPETEGGNLQKAYGVSPSPLGTPSSLGLFGREAGEGKETPSSRASAENRSHPATGQSKNAKPYPAAGALQAGSQPGAAGPVSPTKAETEGSPSGTKASKSGASGFLAAFEDAAFQQPSEEFIGYCVQKHQARYPTPQNLPGIQMEQQQRRWCASVYYRGCQHKRRFSMGRWGPLGAFYAAIEWRQSHYSRLNSLKGIRSPGNSEGAPGSDHKKRRRRSSSGSCSSRSHPALARGSVGPPGPGSLAESAPSEGPEGTETAPGSGLPGMAGGVKKEEAGCVSEATGAGAAAATGLYPAPRQTSGGDGEPVGFYRRGSGGEGVSVGEKAGAPALVAIQGKEEESEQLHGLPEAVAEANTQRFGDENARDPQQPFVGRLESADGTGTTACDRTGYPFFSGFQVPSSEEVDENAVSEIGGKEGLDVERKRRRENEFDSRSLLGMSSVPTADGAFGCFQQNGAPGFGSSLIRGEEDRPDGTGNVHSSHSTPGTCPSFNSPQVPHTQSLSQGSVPEGSSPQLPPPFLSWNEDRPASGRDATTTVCSFSGSFLPTGADSHFHDPRELGKDVGASLPSQLHVSTNHAFNPGAVAPYNTSGLPGFPGTLSATPCRQGAGFVSGGVGVYGQETPPGLGMGFMQPQNGPFDMQHLHSLPSHQMYGHLPHLSGSLGAMGQNGMRPPGASNASGVPLASSLAAYPTGVVSHSGQLAIGQPPLSPSQPLPSGGGLSSSHLLPSPHMYGSWMQSANSQTLNPPNFLLGASGAPTQTSPMSSTRFPPCQSTVSPSLAPADAHGLTAPPFGASVPTGPVQSARAKGGRKEGPGLACAGGTDMRKSTSREKQAGSGPARSRRTKGAASASNGGSLFPVSPYAAPVDPTGPASSFSPPFRPLSNSGSPPLAPANSDGAAPVEWHEGFRRPFGTEGRQQLLRHLRQVYNADSAYWGERLRHANIAFSRIAYATVAELWKIAHVMDCFPIALAFSNRHSATASTGVEDGGALTGAPGTGAVGLPGAAAVGRRACGAKGEKAKGSRRGNSGNAGATASSKTPQLKQTSALAGGLSSSGAHLGVISAPQEGSGNLQTSLLFSESAFPEGGGSPVQSCVDVQDPSGVGTGAAAPETPGDGTGPEGTGGLQGSRAWDPVTEDFSGAFEHAGVSGRCLAGMPEVSLGARTVGCGRGPSEQGPVSPGQEDDASASLGPHSRESEKYFSGDQPLCVHTSDEAVHSTEGLILKAGGEEWRSRCLEAPGDKASGSQMCAGLGGTQAEGTDSEDCMLGMGKAGKVAEYPVKEETGVQGDQETESVKPTAAKPRSMGTSGKRKEEGARQPSLVACARTFVAADGAEEGDIDDASGDRVLSLPRVCTGKKKREAKAKKGKEEGNAAVVTRRKEEARAEGHREGETSAEVAKTLSEFAFVSEDVQTLPSVEGATQ
ncbi:AP2 domain transcription factor AP2IX-5 [Toxoplasma gondii GAB2-2007-GAL-DOM2]|uniref:AP2 domain transcription factor AP2IX-5 n=3 Tax=Toxoplasma gondii TaxID=5811 RepID=A0A086L9L0_TOXGO|nr:AP2 domain transcription factor AP2IX-5 [Toxoplasma gondii GAB2-2007-GAL-DOM2]KFG53328.1 AP2 domain transcription factor AP2IX-5 [Toxoplasma gondii FOU]RQX73746.1 AP2 domain transcription factor AP2IX-5 [Toxoplasma gondii CAST]